MDPCDVVILIPFNQCGIYGAFVSSSLALIYPFMFSRSQIVHQIPVPIVCSDHWWSSFRNSTKASASPDRCLCISELED